MKITLEARKTTWVPFIDSRARLDVEWRSRAEYTAYSVRAEHTWPVKTRYTFSGLETDAPIPSSQLVVMEHGVPVVITSSVVSAVKDRFQSEEIEDPFVVVTDKLASLTRSEPAQRQLARGLIERIWTETIQRMVKVENKTGKAVKLELTIVDRPADELVFTGSVPEPNVRRAPEYVFEVTLEVDAVSTLQLTFTQSKKESIRAPVPAPRRGAGDGDEAEIAQMPDFDDMLTESAAEE